MASRCRVVFVLVLAGLAGQVGCGSAQVGVQEAALPVDSAAQCKSHCQTIGLTLDSVVLMANTVGCVCRAAPAAGSPGAAASSGGMAAILLAQQAAQAEQDERAKQQRAQDEAQKQQQAQPPSPPASP